MEDCAVFKLLQLFGEKWITCILYHVKMEPGIGFNQLKRRLEITPKGLTTKLAVLEEHKLIRVEHVDNRNAYYLSDVSEDIAKVIMDLKNPAEKIFGKDKAC